MEVLGRTQKHSSTCCPEMKDFILGGTPNGIKK
jgi:hypothetical protein